MNTVFVVGSLNIDQTIRVPTFPRAGETIYGSDATFSPGGKGANQAVAVSRAGASVKLVGRIGHDVHGTAILEALAESGVDTSHVKVAQSAATGTAVIAVDDLGENQIILSPGANAALSTSDVDAGLATLGANDVLVLQLEVPRDIVRHAARLGTLRGAFVILNAAPSPPAVDGLFDDIDLLVVNEQEIQDLARLADASGELSDLTEILPPVLGPAVLCTAGAQGAVTFLDGRGVHIPAPEVSVVDTTAAGDTFVGYLAASLAAAENLPAAMAVAGRAAAIAVTRHGAVDSIPWRRELQTAHDPNSSVTPLSHH
ncbi:ribokinase [Paenarthrobacter ureafaciens]|uniref:ribokinase n=1 Tax=Paenarthrobacter ureafaciens TaxID=37931 RepID=UPI0019179E72|nr:ribokinase [Paenarthrobacter ureafaciens]QQQ62590.1 ribokinase [Paenarthrobacter ureafaciens]